MRFGGVESSLIVRVSGFRRLYGRTVAVDGIGFRVEAGRISSNGAGKTTTLPCDCISTSHSRVWVPATTYDQAVESVSQRMRWQWHRGRLVAESSQALKTRVPTLAAPGWRGTGCLSAADHGRRTLRRTLIWMHLISACTGAGGSRSAKRLFAVVRRLRRSDHQQ